MFFIFTWIAFLMETYEKLSWIHIFFRSPFLFTFWSLWDSQMEPKGLRKCSRIDPKRKASGPNVQNGRQLAPQGSQNLILVPKVTSQAPKSDPKWPPWPPKTTLKHGPNWDFQTLSRLFAQFSFSSVTATLLAYFARLLVCFRLLAFLLSLACWLLAFPLACFLFTKLLWGNINKASTPPHFTPASFEALAYLIDIVRCKQASKQASKQRKQASKQAKQAGKQAKQASKASNASKASKASKANKAKQAKQAQPAT